MGKTQARTKILQIIKEAANPISYTRIKQEVGNFCSRVTIYRILLRLENDNLIYRFPDINGDFMYSSFEQNKASDFEKVHFQCLECNTVSTLQACTLENVIPKNYSTQSIHFLAAGICPACSFMDENE